MRTKTVNLTFVLLLLAACDDGAGLESSYATSMLPFVQCDLSASWTAIRSTADVPSNNGQVWPVTYLCPPADSFCWGSSQFVDPVDWRPDATYTPELTDNDHFDYAVTARAIHLADEGIRFGFALRTGLLDSDTQMVTGLMPIDLEDAVGEPTLQNHSVTLRGEGYEVDLSVEGYCWSAPMAGGCEAGAWEPESPAMQRLRRFVHDNLQDALNDRNSWIDRDYDPQISGLRSATMNIDPLSFDKDNPYLGGSVRIELDLVPAGFEPGSNDLLTKDGAIGRLDIYFDVKEGWMQKWLADQDDYLELSSLTFTDWVNQSIADDSRPAWCQ